MIKYGFINERGVRDGEYLEDHGLCSYIIYPPINMTKEDYVSIKFTSIYKVQASVILIREGPNGLIQTVRPREVQAVQGKEIQIHLD